MALVISFAVIMLYIWPEIGNLKEAGLAVSTKKTELQQLQSKKEAVKRIGAQLSGNSETKTLAESYLPNKKLEEQIISRLNFLATDAGVALININIDNSRDSSKRVIKKTTGVDNLSKNALASGGSPQASSNAVNNKEDLLKYVSTQVVISGDYAKMKLFFEQVQRLPYFNSINTLRMYTEENRNSEVPGQGPLMADIIIDFGYVEKIDVSIQEISSFNVELDQSAVSTLKAYISPKTSELIYEVPSGKENPFAR